VIIFLLFSCRYFNEKQKSVSIFTAINSLESIKKFTGDSIVLRPSYEDLDYDKLCSVDSAFYYNYLNGRNEFCPYVGMQAESNDCTQFFYGLITNANTGYKQLVLCQRFNPVRDFLGEWFILNFDSNEELVSVFPVASIEHNYRREILRSSIIMDYNLLYETTCKRIFEEMIVDLDSNKYFLCTDSINVKYQLLKFKRIPVSRDSVRVCNWVENS
jgi:hypothetical protein